MGSGGYGLSALACHRHSKPPSVQVLCDFPHTAAAIPPDYLLDLIPRIRPRAFSIASSLLVRDSVDWLWESWDGAGCLQTGCLLNRDSFSTRTCPWWGW